MSSIFALYQRFYQLPKEARQPLLQKARQRAHKNDGVVRVMIRQLAVAAFALAAASAILGFALALISELLGHPGLLSSLRGTAIGLVLFTAAPYVWRLSELWAVGHYLQIPANLQEVAAEAETENQ